MSVFKRIDKVKELNAKLGNHKIKVIAGVRRCGKTYLLDTLFYNFLIKRKKIDDKSISKIYLSSFDKPLQDEMKLRKRLIDLAKANTRVIIIDEVQLANNYQKILKDFIGEYPNVDLFVTGSNSNTLSTDIIEDFKELGDPIYVYPLTFREIRKEKHKYKLIDYLNYGGLPTVVNAKDKESELEAIYRDVYQLDILDRVENERFSLLSKEDMNDIMINLFSGSTPFSTVEIANKLCERYGFTKDQRALFRKEIKDYLTIVTKSFLFNSFDNESYDKSTPLEILGLNKKYYCCDSGIASNQCKVVLHKLTLALETAVFLQLKQNKIETTGMLLLGDKNNVIGEIDFNYLAQHVQVTYSLNQDNFKREIDNLLAIKDDYQKILIYMEMSIDKKTIDSRITLMSAEDYLTKSA